MGAGASTIQEKQVKTAVKEKRKEAWAERDKAVINDQESLRLIGYRLIKTIGSGSYGKVKKAFSKKHSKNVAIKIIDCNEKNEDYHKRFFKREKQVSYVAKHNNIVKCFEILECGNKIYLILEYMENGDLCR